MLPLLQTDTTAVKAKAIIETIKETPTNELLKDLGLQALHFGLKLLAALALFIIGAWLIKLVRRAVKKALIKKNSEHTIISFTDSFTAVGLWTLLIVLSIGVLGI
ncbi:MAG: hypothetical protein J6W09_01270, partial [Bacteroidales bacterium]|nr:hypothetical protein [Bacteroidales bacterium]